MKKIAFVWFVFATGLLGSGVSSAQDMANSLNVPASIKPYPIWVGYNKTSNILFPYPIKSVDLGNVYLLAEKAKGVDNILHLKAGAKGFPETNLSVVTADGKFYSFLVRYAEDPHTLTLSFCKDNSPVVLTGLPDNRAHFDSIASVIKSQKKSLHIYGWNGRTRVALDAIYLTREMVYLKVTVKNFAPLNYQPSVVRFYLTDRKTAKRTAVHQKELIPVYKTRITPVKYGSTGMYVFAFYPFSIPVSQKLIIHLEAENGQGILELKVSHRAFQKEKLLKLLRGPAHFAATHHLIQTFEN